MDTHTGIVYIFAVDDDQAQPSIHAYNSKNQLIATFPVPLDRFISTQQGVELAVSSNGLLFLSESSVQSIFIWNVTGLGESQETETDRDVRMVRVHSE